MTRTDNIDVRYTRDLGSGNYEGMLQANFTHAQAKQVLFNLRVDQSRLAMYHLRHFGTPKHEEAELGTALRVFLVFLGTYETHKENWVEPFLSTLRRWEVIQTLLLVEASTNFAASEVKDHFTPDFFNYGGLISPEGLNDDAVREFACSGQAWTNCLFLAEVYKAGLVERLAAEVLSESVSKMLS